MSLLNLRGVNRNEQKLKDIRDYFGHHAMSTRVGKVKPSSLFFLYVESIKPQLQNVAGAYVPSHL